MNETEPALEVPILPAMERCGLKGLMAAVRLEGDRLVLVGDQGGRLEIPAGDVERLRIAAFRGRRAAPLYETNIWRKSAPGRLLIVPPAGRPGNYGPLMRDFAGRVFAAGGEVLRGPGLATLVIQLVLTVGSVAFLAALLTAGAMAGGTMAMWITALLAWALAGLLLVGLVRTGWPRRAAGTADLGEFLPSREEGEG